jgi:hypothetical protein
MPLSKKFQLFKFKKDKTLNEENSLLGPSRWENHQY